MNFVRSARFPAVALALALALGSPQPIAAQFNDVTGADVQRLQDNIYQASRDVAQLRGRDTTLASQLQSELDDASVGKRRPDRAECGCIQNASGIAKGRMVPCIEKFGQKSQAKMLAKSRDLSQTHVPKISARTTNGVAAKISEPRPWRR